ncbi:type I-E CRISPR-associated protein Cse2/CasB [Halomonas sp. PAMB 3232]|uniref:type I-E CRISPR-associated protein Cse2/CasB n=1 Tax=Halomonas sp. PAMB 3232 TaxID=3075221 RepID=UPI00289640BC|nr:type I-E CRISPR-associated protein Cse2/CasB [Halomonas sp. PAMB 3232]WNL38603.1 type I-E CRISPR-associated protein Cse2/CasB [Halomonas sp. PAMB 3232]
MASHNEAFITYLQGLASQSTGAMAALRRSLSFTLGQDEHVYPWVERFAGAKSRVDSPRRLALYAVAGLFAHYPHHAHRSFAAAFGELSERRGSATIEKRFIALMEAGEQGLVTHLRQALHLLKAEEIGFDYVTLLGDLSLLLDPQGDERALNKVKQGWGRDYYRAALSEDGGNSDPGAFIDHIQSLVSERDGSSSARAELAVLRRSLAFAPGGFPASFPIVEPFMAPDWSLRDTRRQARYLVAGIAALNPKISERQSLATALGKIALESKSDGIEKRFIALLGADADNLADHLRQTVSLMASADMPFSLIRLLDDLSTWLNPWVDPAWVDQVRQRWARDFYQSSRVNNHSDPQQQSNEGA